MEETIVVITHISGYMAIFLLFCIHQDTKSDYKKFKSAYIDKYTLREKRKDIWDLDVNTLQHEIKCCKISRYF